MLDFAARAGGPVLDYGCGAGEVVAAARSRGIEIYGAEVFYAGGDTRAAAERAGLLETAVFEIIDGRIPFEDSAFNVAVANQVFEHVPDLGETLAELHRVVRPGGTVLSLFPSRDVWREGHLGVPFAHWFARNSWWRYQYVRALRIVGLGANKGSRTPGDWTSNQLDWLDRYCYYRTLCEIEQAFEAKFEVSSFENEWLTFRLAQSRLGWMTPFVRSTVVSRFVTRKLAGLVLVGTKPM